MRAAGYGWRTAAALLALKLPANRDSTWAKRPMEYTLAEDDGARQSRLT